MEAIKQSENNSKDTVRDASVQISTGNNQTEPGTREYA